MRGRRRRDKEGRTQLPILRDFSSVETFVAVMETRSISKAAQRLNTVPSAVSQRLTKIEGLANTKLFNRSTRLVSPTEPAFQLYNHCTHIMRVINTAEQDLWSAASLISGELRIAAPVNFGNSTIAPILPDFARRFPDLTVSIQLSAQEANLIAEGFDVAIRFQREFDPHNGEVLLAENDKVFCASPEYLETYGTPNTPDDLKFHACVCGASNTPFIHWEYVHKGRHGHARIDPVLKTDSVGIMIEACIQGLGICLLGKRAIEDRLNKGEIVPILKGYEPVSNYLIAATPNRSFMPEKAKVFVEFLKSHLDAAKSRPADEA